MLISRGPPPQKKGTSSIRPRLYYNYQTPRCYKPNFYKKESSKKWKSQLSYKKFCVWDSQSGITADASLLGSVAVSLGE